MSLEALEAADLPIRVYEELLLRRALLDKVRSRLRPTGAYRAVLDGRAYPCVRGAWALWIPALETKFLNSIDGRLTCLSRSAPPRDHLLRAGPAGTGRWGNYQLEAWQQAYDTTASRRVAENVVAAARLHRAGLGPRVLGVCLARRFRDGTRRDGSFAIGLMIEDAASKPPKPPATEAELIAAGVRPDHIRSAVRQQVNGYVVDLNSVIGAIPIDAEAAVAALEARILACAGEM